MPTDMRSTTRRDRTLLIGDGFMLTAASFAAALALATGLFLLMGSPDSNVFFGLANSVLMFAGGVVGVIATWLLHGRPITPVVVAGGIAGSAASSVLLPLVAGVAFLLEYPLRLFTTSEFAGPLAMLAILAVASVAMIAWLLVDAARDLAASRREHVRLDIARIAAAAALVVFAAIVGIETARIGGETSEAIIFAMAAGAGGALAVAGAEVATVIAARQHPKAPPVAA